MRVRILNWNIQQGGGSRVMEICRHIDDVDCDLVALTEFQVRNESALRAQLERFGYPFVVTSAPPAKRNGVLIASKWPIALAPGDSPPEFDYERWLAVRVEHFDLDVLALHIPGAPDNKFEDGYGVSGAKRKELFWEHVVAYAANHRTRKTVVLGDFNTGFRIDAEGAMFKQSHFMQKLINEGFVDTWRHLHREVRDYTWYSKRIDKVTGESHDLNGFRLDYVFVSPPLQHAIADAEILQQPRRAGTSDHASGVTAIAVSHAAAQDLPTNGETSTMPQRQPLMEPTRRDIVGGRPAEARSEVFAMTDHPLGEEIRALLRRVDCHYGNTLRDGEAGLSVERAARERNVRTDRIVALRAAVARASAGEHSRTKAQAGHEDGVLRALLHYRGEMSGELRQHVDTRLARLKAEFLPDLKAVPLQCKVRGANQPRVNKAHEHACECGYTHAGECW
jgi:exonuclease III